MTIYHNRASGEVGGGKRLDATKWSSKKPGLPFLLDDLQFVNIED
jgi:hypothetical protein